MDQVSKYLGSEPTKGNKADALIVIAIGANDVLFDANASAAQTTRNIVTMMKKLREHGECYMSWIHLALAKGFVYKAQDISSLRHIPISLFGLTVPMSLLPSINNFIHTLPNFGPH
jgi:hypothetical protein